LADTTFVTKITTIARAWLQDVNDLTYRISTSIGSSLVGTVQSGIGAIARTAQAKMRESFSFQDRGAVGDGVTNDTTTITTALNVANGRETILPFGQYLIPTSISMDGASQAGYDGVILTGQGWDWTRRSNGTELLFSGATGPLFTIQGDPAVSLQLNEVKIRDISIRATNATLTGALLRLCHVVNVVFENCNFEANAAGTLIEGTAWITVRFKHCRFYNAATGVTTAAVAGFGTYANVIKFEDCWFDKLTKSTDFTYAGRTLVFDHCVWEPTTAGAASPNLVGNYNAVFRSCWFGDADGTGTWVTATGEQISIIDTECVSGAIGFDIATTFSALVEGGRMEGSTSAIKLRSTKKGIVRGTRLLLTANNSIGIDVTAGGGHAILDNDVVISGTPTGTRAYRLGSGTTGVLRDRLPGATVDAVVEDNSGLWTVDMMEYEDGVFNTLDDHFLGDVLADQWGSAVGSDPQCVAAAITVLLGGAVRLTSGDDAGGTMALNGSQLHSALNWQASQGDLSCEFRVKLSSTTFAAVFVGLTDQVAALEMPFELAAGDALTSNATDAVGVLYDTAADTDNWWLVGVANDVDATKQDFGAPPITGTYERWKIVISSAGVATFYRNGAKVGTTMAGAVRTTIPLTPVVAVLGRSNGSRSVDVDRIRVRQRN